MKTEINPYKPMPVTTTYGDDYYLTTKYQIAQARKGDETAINSFRKEVAKKAYRQNARYRNLEAKGMQENSVAYRNTLKYLGTDSKPSYSVTRNMPVHELVRLNDHLDRIDNMKTNSVRALRQANARTAKAIGLKFRTQRELDTLMPKFFELDKKLTEYLILQEASSLWRYEDRHIAIFEYINNNNINLADPATSIDTIVERITEATLDMEMKTDYTPPTEFNFFK